MVRPIFFMLSIPVLYCLTLFIISILQYSPTFPTPSDLFPVIQKLHHSSFPLQTPKTFYLNLETTDQKPKSFQAVTFSEIFIESTVFSSAVLNFEVENPNFFYVDSQIFIDIEDMISSDSGKCTLTSSSGVINPGASKTFGPLKCRFLRIGEVSFTAFIVSNHEIIETVRIRTRITGPQLEFVPVASAESLKKFEIINVGDSKVTVTGLFFSDLSCYDTYLEIVDCKSSFILLPDQRKTIEIKGNCDSIVVFMRKTVVIKTSLGEFESEIVINCDFTAAQPQIYFIVFSVSLLLMNLYKTVVPRFNKNVISSIVQEEIPVYDLKKYSKVMIVKQSKVKVESIRIFTSKHKSSMASETTDTHLNSPVNSLNSEELSIDDDYFLDTYKTSGIFSMNTLNSNFNHLS